MSNSIIVKLKYGEEMRRLVFQSNEFNLNKLNAAVSGLYPELTSFHIKYPDEEGDLITVASDMELSEALRQSKDKILRFSLISLSATSVTTTEEPKVEDQPNPTVQESDNDEASVEKRLKDVLNGLWSDNPQQIPKQETSKQQEEQSINNLFGTCASLLQSFGVPPEQAHNVVSGGMEYLNNLQQRSPQQQPVVPDEKLTSSVQGILTGLGFKPSEVQNITTNGVGMLNQFFGQFASPSSAYSPFAGSPSTSTSAPHPSPSSSTCEPKASSPSQCSSSSSCCSKAQPKPRSESDSEPLCTYTFTGENYSPQPWYKCISCGLFGDQGCCKTCAEVCHKGHRVLFNGNSSAFCDCGSGESPSCPPCKSIRLTPRLIEIKRQDLLKRRTAVLIADLKKRNVNCENIFEKEDLVDKLMKAMNWEVKNEEEPQRIIKVQFVDENSASSSKKPNEDKVSVEDWIDDSDLVVIPDRQPVVVPVSVEQAMSEFNQDPKEEVAVEIQKEKPVEENNNKEEVKIEAPKQTAESQPKHPFAQKLDTLHDMGFTDRDKNIRALIKTKANVEEAIVELLQLT